MKDYYYILGVQPSASDTEIKSAYRKLSKKFHPDKNEGEKFFEERFKEIQEAFETLSDQTKRRRYDKSHGFGSQQSTPKSTANRDSGTQGDRHSPDQIDMDRSSKTENSRSWMKWIALTMLVGAVITIVTFSFDGNDGKRPIDLHIEGAGGSMAYFDRYEQNRPYRVDSVKLDGSGKGTLHIAAMPLDFYRISVGDEQLIVVLDSVEGLSIDAQAGLLANPKAIEGSKHTSVLRAFQAEAQGYESKVAGLRAAVAADPSNTANIDELNATNQAFYTSCKRIADENSGSPVAISALGKLDMVREFELFKKVRNDLRKTMPGSGFFTMFRDQVDRYEQEQLAVRMQEEEMKRLSNLLPVGSEAPEIRQTTPDGGTFALSELRGKVVLIDFWASWCRPCRIENPKVKEVYAKYSKKGFEILGVSLDRDHASWVKGIKDDGLPWKHVSDLGFWNNAAAQEYGVSSIPYTVLLDREGKIIEKGLRGDDLDAKLARLFGS